MQTERPHFLSERCTYSFTRFPFVTLLLCTACIVLHYTEPDFLVLEYSRDTCALVGDTQIFAADTRTVLETTSCNDADYWYTPIVYSLSHVGAYHLWQNIVILALSGILLELTEANDRALVTFLISAPLSAGGHGLIYPNRLRGSSGVVYAFIMYQVGLLIKNFREMRYRPAAAPWLAYRAAFSATPTRLILTALLLVSEIILSSMTSNVSHAGHVTGSIVGILCGTAFGSNVFFDPLEIVLPFLGITGIFGIIIVMIASNQIYVSLWAWFATLSCLPLIYKEIIKWSEKYRLFIRGGIFNFAIIPR